MSSETQSAIQATHPLAKWPEGAVINQYNASCHCGKFKYHLDHPSLDVKKPLQCNCTYCTKVGSVFIYGPKDKLQFDESSAPRDELSTFRAKIRPTIHHFCPGCGNYLFWEGFGIVGVNIRMIEGIEIDKLGGIMKVDGRNEKIKGVTRQGE